MLQKFIEIVKQQLEYWHRQVAVYGPDHPRYRPTKISKYQYLIRDFTDLLGYLQTQAALHPDESIVGLPERTVSFAHPQTRLATMSAAAAAEPDLPDELSDLPPELLNELSESIKGETDPLIKIINERGGTATLDEILIDLWRKYKEVGKRAMISNKLYRLSRRGLCWPIAGKKGIYTTTKPKKSGNPPPADGNGSDVGSSDTPSGTPETPVRASSSISSKARRELFASTAIPNRVPH